MPPPPPEGDREDDGGDPYASSASDLPVTRYASEIVEAVRANPVVVVIGETGSGKTTQISQILHRANLSSSSGDNNAPPSSSSTGIVVTQPRRVAAVSVARRVAHEMNVPVGGLVGYTVRFEDCSGRDTRIKYVTDGTLLRECLEDPSLSKYGVVILDEAHERSLNTDVPVRPPEAPRADAEADAEARDHVRDAGVGEVQARSLITPVPIRPRSRGARRSWRTLLPGMHFSSPTPRFQCPPSTPFNSS